MSAFLKEILTDFNFSSQSYILRVEIYEVFKQLRKEWIESPIFEQIKAYPELEPYIPKIRSPEPYVRFIERQLLLYAAFTVLSRLETTEVVEVRDYFQGHHYIPKHVLKALNDCYTDFPFKALMKEGPNVVFLIRKAHIEAHALLYKRFNNYFDLAAVTFINNGDNSEVDVEVLRAMGRAGSEILRKKGQGMFNKEWQKAQAAKAWSDPDRMRAIVTENGRKGNKEGKRRSWLNRDRAEFLTIGFLGGRASQQGKTFQTDDVFFWTFRPDLQERKSQPIEGFDVNAYNSQPRIGVFVTGYNLPKDVARILNKYRPHPSWDLASAGKRLGETIRAGRPSYVSWRVEKVEATENQTISDVKTNLAKAFEPLGQVFDENKAFNRIVESDS